MDHNKAENASEEKIRGKRNAAWGRLEEGGRVVNTRVGKSREEQSTERLPVDGELESSGSTCREMERKVSKGEMNRSMSSPAL